MSQLTAGVSRWWARQVVKNIPPSDMMEVRAKVAALSALRGERKDWGISRAWEGDYLANVSGLHTAAALGPRPQEAPSRT